MISDAHTHKVSSGLFVRNIFLQDFDSDTDYGGMVSVGLHPWHADLKIDIAAKLTEALHHPQCVAVGEIGLDKVCNKDYRLQQRVFEEQLTIAAEAGKPVVIHNVRSFEDILRTIGKFQNGYMLHGFSGNEIMGDRAVKAGIMLSYGHGLFDRPEVQKTFTNTPLKNILLETDESDYDITEIYQQAAKLLKTDENKFVEKIYNNFLNFFGDI